MESNIVSSPAKAGDPVTPGNAAEYWTPAFAGMTLETDERKPVPFRRNAI
jgi:hypothetical protein